MTVELQINPTTYTKRAEAIRHEITNPIELLRSDIESASDKYDIDAIADEVIARTIIDGRTYFYSKVWDVPRFLSIVWWHELPIVGEDDEFTYTAEDGEEVTGTAQYIGEVVEGWWREHSGDEPQPFWWKWSSVHDDHMISCDYTIEEVCKWLARREDRALSHVKRDFKRI